MISVKRDFRKMLMFAAAFLVVVIAVSPALSAGAEMVEVYKHINPSLTMANIYDAKSLGWPCAGTISQDGEKYSLTTNARAYWDSYDSLDFAYERVDFNTGKGSVLTLETTVDKWAAEQANASVGLMVRDSLDANAPSVFLCFRKGTILLMNRKTGDVVLSAVTDFSGTPISLRMVANKSKRSVSGYYKYPNTAWTFLGTCSYVAPSRIYVGLAAHSVDKDRFETAGITGFTAALEAPEGYEVEDDTSSAGQGGQTSSEPEVVLPPDLPVTGDTLLSETFTDGNLFHENSQTPVTDPFWTVREGKPLLALNSDSTDRYLKLNAADSPLFMTAGAFEWTDYSASFDFRFLSDEVDKGMKNNLTLLFRHKSMVIGGSSDYGVTLVNKFQRDEISGQWLQLNYRGSSNKFIPVYTTLAEVQLAQGTMIDMDVTHKLRVEAIDNTFQIYLDNNLLISYQHEDINPNLLGCIGIYASDVSAEVDNILVRKLSDPLGGDYDNRIGGRFNEPIPDYIKDTYGVK